MGLDTTHGCWHGAYSAFMRWRSEVAKAAGYPPLMLMEGFYTKDERGSDPFWRARQLLIAHGSTQSESFTSDLESFEYEVERFLPISWAPFAGDPLHRLLHHSDCDGVIKRDDCWDIADRLEEVMAKMPKGEAGGHIRDWSQKTQTFIDGLRLAHENFEDVEFS